MAEDVGLAIKTYPGHTSKTIENLTKISFLIPRRNSSQNVTKISTHLSYNNGPSCNFCTRRAAIL